MTPNQITIMERKQKRRAKDAPRKAVAEKARAMRKIYNDDNISAHDLMKVEAFCKEHPARAEGIKKPVKVAVDLSRIASFGVSGTFHVDGDGKVEWEAIQ